MDAAKNTSFMHASKSHAVHLKLFSSQGASSCEAFVCEDLADVSPLLLETFLLPFALYAVVVPHSSIYLLAVHIPVIISMLAS